MIYFFRVASLRRSYAIPMRCDPWEQEQCAIADRLNYAEYERASRLSAERRKAASGVQKLREQKSLTSDAA